jgi:glycerate kinase
VHSRLAPGGGAPAGTLRAKKAWQAWAARGRGAQALAADLLRCHDEDVPRLLAAPDKFRGTLSASQAAQAIAEAAQQAGWECDVAPVSDGGEGFLEAFATAGAVRRRSWVPGPLGRQVQAEWLLCRPDAMSPYPWAVIESAQVVGMSLVGGPEGNDPVRANTIGVGRLVAVAAKAGARQVIVGMGGSCTTDGGLGAVEALGWHGPATAQVVGACDVQARFCDAAAVFSPQKGATATQVEFLRRRMERVAQLYQERCGREIRDLPGTGAAGGLAGGLAALGAQLVPGFELVAERLELAERIGRADLVVTGEGRLDRQSFHGKAVGGVVGLAQAAGVPYLVVVGEGERGLPIDHLGLVERFGASRARDQAAECLREVVTNQLALGLGG